MVKVCSVYHILNEPIFLVVIQPLALLLHYFMEWVSIVCIPTTNLNLLIQCGVQLHDWIVTLLGDVFEEACSSYIVPVLRIMLQKPSVIVLCVHVGSLNQIWNLGRRCCFVLAIIAFVDGDVPSEQMLHHVGLCNYRNLINWKCFNLSLLAIILLVLAKIKQRTLIWCMCFKRIKVCDLCIVWYILVVKHIIVIGVYFVSFGHPMEVLIGYIKLRLFSKHVTLMLWWGPSFIYSAWLCSMLLFNERLHFNSNILLFKID